MLSVFFIFFLQPILFCIFGNISRNLAIVNLCFHGFNAEIKILMLISDALKNLMFDT